MQISRHLPQALDLLRPVFHGVEALAGRGIRKGDELVTVERVAGDPPLDFMQLFTLGLRGAQAVAQAAGVFEEVEVVFTEKELDGPAARFTRQLLTQCPDPGFFVDLSRLYTKDAQHRLVGEVSGSEAAGEGVVGPGVMIGQGPQFAPPGQPVDILLATHLDRQLRGRDEGGVLDLSCLGVHRRGRLNARIGHDISAARTIDHAGDDDALIDIVGEGLHIAQPKVEVAYRPGFADVIPDEDLGAVQLDGEGHDRLAAPERIEADRPLELHMLADGHRCRCRARSGYDDERAGEEGGFQGIDLAHVLLLHLRGLPVVPGVTI